jgi:hypothetical protein
MAGTSSNKAATSTQDAKSTPTETVPEAMDFGVEGWRPEKGDTLTGTVEDITSGGSGSEYGKYPILVLSTKEGGKVAVHAFHHTLKNRLLEMRPKLGHTLTITYLGEEPQYDRDGMPKTRNGQPMTLNQYTVTSPEFEFSWDSFA